MLCLDSRQRLRFTIAGIGVSIDNHGTTKASRVVELHNDRVAITAFCPSHSSMLPKPTMVRGTNYLVETNSALVRPSPAVERFIEIPPHGMLGLRYRGDLFRAIAHKAKRV